MPQMEPETSSFSSVPKPHGCDLEEKEGEKKKKKTGMLKPTASVLPGSWNKDVVGRQEAASILHRSVNLPAASVLETPAALHLSAQLARVSQPIRLWRE